MSFIFKEQRKKEKSKTNNSQEKSSCSSLEYQPKCNRSALSEISASELSYLTAQVWTLENRLREEKRSSLNLTESFQSVANEKYELLQELTCQKQLFQQLNDDLQRERENNAELANEVECLRKEVHDNHAILEKAVTQNVELKQSIIGANETIHQMGLMYLKLKEYHH